MLGPAASCLSAASVAWYGVLGGMTTFSALMLECLMFARTDRPGMVVAYLAASLAGGLLLVWAGALAGRALHG